MAGNPGRGVQAFDQARRDPHAAPARVQPDVDISPRIFPVQFPVLGKPGDQVGLRFRVGVARQLDTARRLQGLIHPEAPGPALHRLGSEGAEDGRRGGTHGEVPGGCREWSRLPRISGASMAIGPRPKRRAWQEPRNDARQCADARGPGDRSPPRTHPAHAGWPRHHLAKVSAAGVAPTLTVARPFAARCVSTW